MSKLPKSIVIEGRRYPTWTLSVNARKQLVNLSHVNAHIAELHQRLDRYQVARNHYHLLLTSALPDFNHQPSAPETPRYFWQSFSKEWAQQHWPISKAASGLSVFETASHYRQGDHILCYVKGYGLVGCGFVEMDTNSTKMHLVWDVSVPTLDKAIPAKILREFSLRHPNRPSQMVPPPADIEGLLSALATKAAS